MNSKGNYVTAVGRSFHVEIEGGVGEDCGVIVCPPSLAQV